MQARGSSPEAALDKVFELAVRLTETMQRGLAERGLTPSRAEILLVLDQDGPMVQRQISEHLRCTPRYVTALIDRLEAEALVRRRPHPTDRRATLVSLTKRGSAAAARMATQRRQAAQWLLGDIPPDALATLVMIAGQVLDRISAAMPAAGVPDEGRTRVVTQPPSPPRPSRSRRSLTSRSGAPPRSAASHKPQKHQKPQKPQKEDR